MRQEAAARVREAEREARWRLSEGRKLVQQLGEMLGIASTGH